ncbi:GDSL-type esterase/lipase family protein [Paenibacillus mucilaginosus]|uniref:Lipase/acylhydrolase with GDSL-like motif n=2 Tax=Paenibacillus mucilaginosus TaxID=61624 RepID=H6NAM6_9BACL|nr:GDSL-type esterase/lipase family protein [Paenibacillus mucilaginosus]AEI41406.1 Lipase/Acylhydrolase with GDSL-like motif [Paenibacillus mucilaginosus KNP414]AFC29951.1 Lipase/acylhydrolase with GDSL-like motif [Paenibacillus mucilaginosus 3016]MCG7217538.1 GDSL-type esterase/lipase family protein [Paenibacillus mucilaginosus]WDM30426.1 lipase [Paenibacillus mucilaginosus]WFA18609.1 lipase [Paenibacillus mucilaginosus]
MFSTKWLWRTAGSAALLSTLLCAFGFGYAVNQILYPEPAPAALPGEAAPQPAVKKEEAWEVKNQIRIVAIGDSLTAGTGDLAGKGYVGHVKEKLEQKLGKPVFVYNNFAIPGFRTYDLLKDWDAKQDITKSLGEADLVLMTIGGNDLFEGGTGIFGETGEGFNPQAAADRIPEAAKRLGQIMERTSKAAPNARILYVGLYHPFLDLDPEKAGAPVVQRWNAAAFEAASRYPNITVVPTYDLFELNLNKYLYTDHFHPNAAGYERIAGRIVDILG